MARTITSRAPRRPRQAPVRPDGSPPPTGARRERRKREVHDRIREAAVALFDTCGYEATTIDDICSRADVAQKTFFNHFPTRQHLLREIAGTFLDQLLVLLDQARGEPDTQARLSEFFRRVAEEAEEAGPMHRELIVEVIRDSQVDGADPEKTRRLHRSFRRLIEDGLAAGDVTGDHSVELLTEMTVGAFYTVMLNWVTLDRYPLGQRAAETARFLGRAIGS